MSPGDRAGSGPRAFCLEERIPAVVTQNSTTEPRGALGRWNAFQLSVYGRLHAETGLPMSAIIERFATVMRRDFGWAFFGNVDTQGSPAFDRFGSFDDPHSDRRSPV